MKGVAEVASVSVARSRVNPLTRLARAASWDWGMKLGLVVLVIFVGIAILGPTMAPYEWTQINRDERGVSMALRPPSSQFLLGTTNMGRDVYSQVLVGARGALAVGISASLSVVVIGMLLGLLAGYFRGWVETLIMRIVDIAYSLPMEPIAIVLLSIVSSSFLTMVLAVSMLAWRGPARIIRAQVLSIAQRPYIKSARILGAGHGRLIFLHIMPDVLPLALMYLPLAFGRAAPLVGEGPAAVLRATASVAGWRRSVTASTPTSRWPRPPSRRAVSSSTPTTWSGSARGTAIASETRSC